MEAFHCVLVCTLAVHWLQVLFLVQSELWMISQTFHQTFWAHCVAAVGALQSSRCHRGPSVPGRL
jgi:hypothetical protein